MTGARDNVARWHVGSGGARPWSRPRFDLARQQRLAALVAPALLAGFFVLYIVGDHPFATSAVDKATVTESGSLLNRLLIFGMLGLLAPVLLVRLKDVAGLLAANLPGGLIVAWSLLSVAWASHPDLTIRRGIAFGAVYLNLAVIVASTRSALTVFRALALAVAWLTLLNILVMVGMPAVSHSPIGEKGIFDAKNTAGTLGMLAVVWLGVSLFVFRAHRLSVGLGVVYLMSWIFLVATKSKTSLGVTIVMTVAGPFLYLLLRRGRGLRVAALLAVAAGGCGLVAAASAAGYTSDDLLLLLFGDLTFTQRTPIWGDIARTIADRPWLGYGFGSFWDVGAALNPLRYAPYDVFYMDAQEINTAHNGYLDQLLQTGIVGFGLGVAAILRCVGGLWSTAVRTESEDERVALLGLLCIAICLILNNFLESYLFRSGDGIGYLFFVIMLQADQARLGLAGRARATAAGRDGCARPAGETNATEGWPLRRFGQRQSDAREPRAASLSSVSGPDGAGPI